MVHGAACVQESPACEKVGTVEDQGGGGKGGWPRSVGPPKSPPSGQNPPVSLGSVGQAPEGSTAMFPAEPFWGPLSMNALAKNVVYMTLDPPRSTVVPLPVTSQAKPTRGEKSLRLGFQSVGRTPGSPC